MPAGGDRARPARAASARSATATGPDRDFGPHVVRQPARRSCAASLRGLQREGFRHVFVLRRAGGGRRGDDRARAAVERPARRARPVRHHRRRARLLRRAGRAAASSSATTVDGDRRRRRRSRHPEGRKAVFVGDLVDRGPAHRSAVLRLVMDMVAAGTALCVPGNHDVKLLREAAGRDVQSPTAWPRRWPSSSAAEPPEFRDAGRASSSTGWSATTSSTTASWSSPTPG